jgi:hypothetical protein
MPSHVLQRPATEAERAALQLLLANAATPFRRWKIGAANALVVFAGSLLGVVIVWMVVAWLARTLFNVEYGLHSPVSIWVLGVAMPLCAGYAIVSSLGWIRAWRGHRPELRTDVDEARVDEEHYVFKEVKRFQEQEHGGLFYFLRTADDKVFALFDHESQDLGCQGEDPLKSSFKPMSELVLVRAPQTRFVIGSTFSGLPLEAGDPIDLVLDPEEWPESESYCAIPWFELGSRLGPAKAIPRTHLADGSTK